MMSNPNRVLRSWVDVSPDSDFSIHNIPFGIGRPPGSTPRLFTAIGQYAADLQVLAEHGFFDDLDIDRAIFSSPTLNPFIALGREKTRAVRQRLIDILDDDLDEWDASQLKEFFLLPQAKVSMLLPLQIGDYTDFYSSREHATNVGAMFRDPQNALLPNWLHLPVAYHGRASSIVVSGTPIRRPQGQTMPDGAPNPQFGPSRLLDFELEMAFVIGRENAMGHPVSTAEAEDYIFGLVLFNDWSARDIQRWEYQPLGPFLSKNFASTISPWVVTLDALEPFRCASPEPEIAPLPYLQYTGNRNFDIQLEVALQTASGAQHTICRSNFRYLYWNMSQQLAHHTVNGCPLRIGDLCASGTISGPNNESYGSMLELTWRGTQPIQLPDGSERRFLHDGDTVIMRGFAQKEGIRVGFGEARGTLIPALQ